MSSNAIAISVKGLGKNYTIAHNSMRPTTLREAIVQRVRHPFGNGRQDQETFWALRDVNFEIRQGEVVGFVGRNGAGKSTLLKLLSRITGPTTGTIDIHGRIASLLEVGTGFHPELTGRENIYLNGAVLGMSRREITSKFDEIVAFAEVEQFLDTPVKRYSSGMYVRLAFAVAAHLEPEIMILDEVLSVGDASFQKKCMGKIGKIERDGRTVLLVSHSMSSVVNLCHRAILIRQGRVVVDGSVDDVVQAYLKSGDAAGGEVVWPEPDQAPGTDLIRIHAVRIFQEEAKPTSDIDVAKDVIIEISYWVLQSGQVVYAALWLKDQMGTCVLSTQHSRGISLTEDPWAHRPRPTGLYRSRCIIPANTLNSITYRVTPILGKDICTTHLQLEDLLTFVAHDTEATLQDMPVEFQRGWMGVIRPKLAWNTELDRSN
jgi:lipopolysaccharide transport system ATP-binding protein